MSFSVKARELFFERIGGQTESPNTSIQGIAKDSIGYIWFGTWNGVYRYDGLNFKVYNTEYKDSVALLNNRIRNVIVDKNKQIWILTFDNEYARYIYSGDCFRPVSANNVSPEVVDLLKSGSNKINQGKIINGCQYYLSAHRFSEYQKKTKTTRVYSSNSFEPGGLTDDFITSFYIDNQDIIWLGTRNGTIYMANTGRNPFSLHHNYSYTNNIARPTSIRAILKTNNDLWLGTNHSGLYITNDKTYCIPDYRQSNIRSFYQDKFKNIWIGGTNGLDYYNAATDKYFTVINNEKYPGLDIYSVYCLCPSKNNYMWGGLYNALAKINIKTRTVSIINLADIIKDHSVMDILETHNTVWLATEGNGVIRLKFDISGNCIDTLLFNSQAKRQRQLTGNLVYALYKDHEGDIWAGTSEGLNCINPVSNCVRHIKVKDGLPANYISAITGDKKGDIWISHKKGISKVIKKPFQISNYYIRNNNINWSFLDGACFNDTTKDVIYLGAREGYMSFHPSQIKKDRFCPKMLLTAISIRGEKVIPNKPVNKNIILEKVPEQTSAIRLRHVNHSFTIEMNALHFSNNQDIKYFYFLDGFDKTQIGTSINKAVYTKVPPGSYSFIARAVTSDGLWSDVVCLDIRILHPWYSTPWAIATYILLVVAILFLGYREILIREKLRNQVKIEQLNAQKQDEINNEKMDFFTNVSHELRTPLTLITDPVSQLQKNDLNEKDRALYFDIITRNIAQLTLLINQLLDFRKIETGKAIPEYKKGDMAAIIRQCTNSFKLMAEKRNINLDFIPKNVHLIGYFDAPKTKQIITNLISNALKYTPNNGNITITLCYNNPEPDFSIIIKDNGMGIPRKSMKKIFEPFNNEGAQPFYGFSSGMGLALTRKLVELLNGTVTIESYQDKGTTVKVVLPYKKADSTAILPENEKTNTEIFTTEKKVSSLDKKVLTPSSKPMVLVVEDNADMQDYIANELKRNYAILLENNGQEGYTCAVKNIPDIIISDVMMPQMDGIEFCRKIKNNEVTNHIPVILLTAKSSDKNRIEGFKTGADFYIAKPFSIDILKAQIESIIQNREKLLAKLSGEKVTTEQKLYRNPLDKNFIDKTRKIIENNIDNLSFNAEELAGTMSVSRRQLYRKLYAISGCTVSEFMLKIKMERAVELLSDPQLNISQVAYKLGFSEASNFSRTFNKYYGSSPSAYKKNMERP